LAARELHRGHRDFNPSAHVTRGARSAYFTSERDEPGIHSVASQSTF
jgi:hypothetical protein